MSLGVDQSDAERALKLANNNPEAALAYLLEPSSPPPEENDREGEIEPELSPSTGLSKGRDEDRGRPSTEKKGDGTKRGGRSIFGKLAKFGSAGELKRNSQDNLKKPLSSSEPVLIPNPSPDRPLTSGSTPPSSSSNLPLIGRRDSRDGDAAYKARSGSVSRRADMLKRMTETGIEPSVAAKAVDKHGDNFNEALLEAMITEIAPQ